MIRAAQPTDAPALATVQIRSWWAAYGAAVAHEKIAAAAERVPDAWHERLAPGAPVEAGIEVWVAERDGAPSGFVSLGPSRDADAGERDGELRAIYVDPERFGTGDGHALLEHAEARLRALGHPAATLWVLAANAHARRFYERHGWAIDARPGAYPYPDWGPCVRYRKVLEPTP